MKPTLLLLLVAVAVVLQISETRVVMKRDANGKPQYAYAVTAEEMAAGGRIARNADALSCCDYNCSGRPCSCCYA